MRGPLVAINASDEAAGLSVAQVNIVSARTAQDLIQHGFKAGGANTTLDQERPAGTVAFYPSGSRRS